MMANTYAVTPSKPSPLNTKVLLTGHSFLKRLESYDKSYKTLQLKADDFDLTFSAVGGDNLVLLRDRLGKVIPTQKSLKPNIVYIEIGSNDLCSVNNSPDIVAKKIMDITRYLHYGHGVQKVIIGQILQRLRRHQTYFSRCLSLAAYNKKVQETNEILQKLALSQKDFMLFWKHKGFTSPQVNVFGQDGVHPSIPIGMIKYTCSVRHAVVHTRNKFSKLWLQVGTSTKI